MRHGSLSLTPFLIAALFVAPGPSAAQHDHAGHDHDHDHAHAEAQATPITEPSKEHGFLQRMVGTWEAKTRFWMEPDKPPIEGTGVAKNDLILGGRFLQSNFTGQMLGPFEGIGIDGFDRTKQKYVSTWMDNKGTMIMMFEGEVQGNARTMTTRVVGPDGKPTKIKWVTTLVSNNSHRAEGYQSQAGGEFRKMMEITFTRR